MKVILLVVDSLRADYATTPNIRRLAEGGVEYLNARSMGSSTSTSVRHVLSEYLACYLKGIGSKTNIVIHANVNVKMWAEKAGYEQIDLYEELMTKKMVNLIVRGIFKAERRAERLNKVGKLVRLFPSPSFLCFWYMDVHAPYMPPGSGIRAYSLNRRLKDATFHRGILKGGVSLKDIGRAKKLYRREVEYFDGCLGRFLGSLKGDELVVLTSDHGEEFFENGDWGHKNKDIDVLRHVPLIFYGPGIKPGVVEEEFSFRKFDKTLIEYMGEG